ncbi:unnamed protein product, partial [marine sediment metagenome]
MNKTILLTFIFLIVLSGVVSGATIILQNETTENLDDGGMITDAPDSEKGGANDPSLRAYYNGSDEVTEHFMIKFNISKVVSDADSISEAFFYLYSDANRLDSGESFNLSHYHVYINYTINSKEWTEGDSSGWVIASDNELNWNDRPSNSSYFNPSPEGSQIIDDSTPDPGWLEFNCTDMVTQAFNWDDNNISIWLNVSSRIGNPSNFDYLEIWSKEYMFDNSKRPYLEITFTESTSPTYSNFQNNASSTSRNNTDINFSIDLVDNTDLDYYIFAHNLSTILTNGTPVDISGTSYFANVTITINVSGDNYICGQFWFNDTSGNINQTNLSCFTVANTTLLMSDIVTNSPQG